MTWLRKWILRWEVITAICVTLLIAWFGTRAFLFDYFRVPSASMHPTIREDSLIVVDKRGFGNYGLFGFTPVRTKATSRIARGDIILFRLVDDPRVFYAHRAIGLSGDRIEYKSRQLTINGEAISVEPGEADAKYQYATETIDGREVTVAFMAERYSRDFDDVVPKDHVFVLGDNRDNARDSRFIGFVPTDNVIGIVFKTIGAGGP